MGQRWPTLSHGIGEQLTHTKEHLNSDVRESTLSLILSVSLELKLSGPLHTLGHAGFRFTWLNLYPGSHQRATVLRRLLGALCPPVYVHSDFSINFPQQDQCGRPGCPLCPWPQPRYPPAYTKGGGTIERRAQPLLHKLNLEHSDLSSGTFSEGTTCFIPGNQNYRGSHGQARLSRLSNLQPEGDLVCI